MDKNPEAVTGPQKRRDALQYLYDRDHYLEYKDVRDVLLTYTPADWSEYARDDQAVGLALLNIVETLYADGAYTDEAYERAIKVLDL